MRLTAQEIAAIRHAVIMVDPNAKVFLFGSRVDDQKRGGDIDLLVESKIIGFSQKIDILVAIKSSIGEQKIDLLLTKDLKHDSDPFVRSIAKQAVSL